MAATLRERGWHLSDEGLEQCQQNGKPDLERVALDTDLREVGKAWLPEEISRGRADYVEGPGVVQLQKIRNVSAPKDNEDSQAAPRLMKLTLTDGHATCQAIETEVLRDLGVNTPPGSKIKLKSTIDIEHGFLLLNNKNTQFLGGRVEKLVEGWELKKKLALQTRLNVGSDGGGPPPFVPFGLKIDNSQIRNPRRDNFRSMDAGGRGEKERERKVEDEEFEQQRRATIAEALAAKEEQAAAKRFGGGQKQASSDHEIAKITEMGFRADEAATALRLHNGNVQQAIDYLLTRKKPGGPNRQSSYESDRGGDRGRGRRDRRDDDGGGGGPGRGRRGRGDTEESGEGLPSKPSGPATLFDFLTTKFPAGESKGTVKDEKTNSSQTSVSEKFSDKQTQQTQDTRDRPRSAHNVNPESSSMANRPKPQQSIPPRFVNKSKQDTTQSYPKGQGRYHDDRSERPRDDRPRTGPSDRNYDNRNYSDRNYNDRNYSDRNYNDRNYDRNYNDRNRGYNDRRTNDYGDNRGNRDNRGGERGQNYNRTNNSDYNQRNTNNSASASAKSNTDDKRGPKDKSENQEHQSNEKYKSRNTDTTSNSQYNKSRTDVNSGNQNQKSQNYQKGQNEKTEQSANTADTGGNRRDNYSKGGGSQQIPQNNYRGGARAHNNQNFVPNGGYGNQQPMGYSGGPPPPTSAPYQPRSDFMYAEVLPFGLKQGDKVLAKYWEDGVFYEAVIEYYAPNLPTCMVTFIDYGNFEEVLLTDIKPILPHMAMGQHGGPVLHPDMSVPPPGVFFSAPPPTVPAGLDDSGQSINSMEFRRGGGGAAYNRKEGRPAQQLYQPPSQRR